MSPTKGRGYGHVTVLKFCRFALIQRVARVRQRQFLFESDYLSRRANS